MQELVLMSHTTVAHPVLTNDTQDLTLSKRRQDTVPAKHMPNLKHVTHHLSNTINPLTSIIFKHPTEQFCLFAYTEINISCAITHSVTHSTT